MDEYLILPRMTKPLPEGLTPYGCVQQFRALSETESSHEWLLIHEDNVIRHPPGLFKL